MIAVISDVHGNYDALEAVLAEIDRLQCEAIICLGDMVGYGPEPVRCVDEVRRRCEVILCGNHDYALVYGDPSFSQSAKASLEAHRRMLMPRPGAGELDRDRQERWDFMKSLPYRHVRDETLFVHASPRNPVGEYLRKIDVLLGMNRKIIENFKQVDWLCFIGHTHRPGIITPDMKFVEPSELGNVYHPTPHHKAIINVGSVGQPRDNDWRACFVTIEDDGTVRYHRVEYDLAHAIARIEATPGIDNSLADRLRQGR